MGVILTLNNAGVISDPGFAVFSTGSIGRIVNAGQIIGNVEIDNQSVTITGGGGQGKTTFGSLKGGTITIRDGDLAFAGGATDLADNIVVQDGGKVTNDGVLRLAAPQTIAGGFSQGGSGVLDLEIAGDRFGQYGALTVAGLATLGGELALDPINGFRLGRATVSTCCRSAQTSGVSPASLLAASRAREGCRTCGPVPSASVSTSALGLAGWT